MYSNVVGIIQSMLSFMETLVMYAGTHKIWQQDESDQINVDSCLSLECYDILWPVMVECYHGFKNGDNFMATIILENWLILNICKWKLVNVCE